MKGNEREEQEMMEGGQTKRKGLSSEKQEKTKGGWDERRETIEKVSREKRNRKGKWMTMQKCDEKDWAYGAD